MTRTPFCPTLLAAIASLPTLSAQMPEPAPAAPPTPMADQDGRPYHLVAEGDSLLAIAATYNLTLQQLTAINKIRNNTISVGQRLYLTPAGAKVELPPRGGRQIPQTDSEGRPFHIVATGENPFAIAARYGVDLYKMIALNGIRDYTVTPGQKLLLPVTEGSAPKAPEPPEHDAVALVGRESGTRSQEVLASVRSSRVRSGVIPIPRKGVAVNPDAGRPAPSNPVLVRPALQPDGPPRTAMAELLAPLPLIDRGTLRSEWTPTQESIAAWWEKAAVRTVGILTGAQWVAGSGDACLVLTLSPSSRTAATVRVSIPGAYLPAEIDTIQFARWAATRVPVEVVGHLRYLDGPGPAAAIRAGSLLSPWSIVAQHAAVHIPAGPWTPITTRIPRPAPALPTAPGSEPGNSGDEHALPRPALVTGPQPDPTPVPPGQPADATAALKPTLPTPSTR